MTDDEGSFIASNAATMSPENIARRLDRTVEVVKHYISKNNIPTVPLQELQKQGELNEIRAELKESERWGRLKQEMTRDELKFFEEEYVKLYAQFKSDVTASETSQIFDAIKLDVLKSRNLIERKKIREYISTLEKRIEMFVDKNGPNPASWSDNDREYLTTLEGHIKEQKADEQSRTKEYVSLQERHDSLIRTLKGTRDQRFKDVENSKESFLGLLKKLQQQEVAELEGRDNALMGMAAEKEYKRLGSHHTYEDGVIDRPILSCETVNMEESA